MSKENKLIQVKTSTYQKLYSIGKFGDTFDSIINKLLENQGSGVPDIK